MLLNLAAPSKPAEAFSGAKIRINLEIWKSGDLKMLS
jgi:hypothetical protein